MKKGMVLIVLVVVGLLGVPLLVWTQDERQTPTSRASSSTGEVAVQAAGSAAQPAAGNDRVYLLEDYDGVVVLDTRSGERERDLPALAFAPDGSTAYAVEYDGRATNVRALDPASGTRLGETSVAGRYDWPHIGPLPAGLSPNGHWLALQSVPWEEQANPRSRFVVVDTSFEAEPRLVDLPGVFEFDALSNDGNSLYLIEYGEVWRATSTYQVRRYDLRQDTLDPAIIADKRNPDEKMVGVRHAAVASLDGAWLYSLYVDYDSGKVFVHALNLDEAIAVCIDLPSKAGEGEYEGQMWGLARSPDGSRLYVANGWQGLVIEVDAYQLVVGRTAELEMPQAGSGDLVGRIIRWLAPSAWAKFAIVNPVVLSPGGEMLYTLARQGVLAVDTATLTVQDHYLDGRVLTSLALNATGDRLYSLEVDSYQVLGLDLISRELMVEMEGDQLWWGLLRVETRHEDSQVPETCPVTLAPDPPFFAPAPYPPEAPDRGRFWYGRAALWTSLPDDGRWGQLQHGEKVFWWSEAYEGDPQPEMAVTGRRLDADEGSLEASAATNAFHDSFVRAMLTGVEVSTPGCWEITGRYGGEELSFVVWVAP